MSEKPKDTKKPDESEKKYEIVRWCGFAACLLMLVPACKGSEQEIDAGVAYACLALFGVMFVLVAIEGWKAFHTSHGHNEGDACDDSCADGSGR